MPDIGPPPAGRHQVRNPRTGQHDHSFVTPAANGSERGLSGAVVAGTMEGAAHP